MRGTVTGHNVAVIPDKAEKVSKGGIVLAEDFDSDKKARADAAATTGIVVGIGATAWRAYDGDDPNWKPWANLGDRVWFVRHVSKVIEDKDDLDDNGNPTKIFIMADENIIFNMGKPEAKEDE